MDPGTRVPYSSVPAMSSSPFTLPFSFTPQYFQETLSYLASSILERLAPVEGISPAVQYLGGSCLASRSRSLLQEPKHDVQVLQSTGQLLVILVFQERS